ncbi:FecR family protein [Teredinibacter sp. KSP-S5-2]|uniref:FecR family protein n=1 Tax=Teredinibacter sp. KSP-S5-2 TaxID=3034506 RepID=UPI00293433B5|nr:FecR domain-containing protein [Teredinibacter sp. KSP-S5-2]WNO07621.1 FecR domain-containing protein [Teredinibacter sp. KSP-S5-2]
MSKVVSISDQANVKVASDWFAKIVQDSAIESSKEFKLWLESSESNRLAYEQCKLSWEMMSLMAEDADVLDALNDLRGSRQSIARPFYRRFRYSLAAAACVLVAVTAFMLNTVAPDKTDVYITTVGEQRSVELMDGSSIQINTDTRLEVSYTPELRKIRLVYGEAYFDVAKDKQRPFEVYAAAGVVKAVGTAFNVSYLKKRIKVDVAEGIVEVSKPSYTMEGERASSGVLAELGVGQAAGFNEQVSDLTKGEARLDKIEAWRQNKIYFDDDPLDEVVDEFERYSTYRIEIRSQSLKKARVSGIFNVGDHDTFLFTLEKALGAKIRRMDKTVYLYSRNEDG